jgi:hypothetical protein
LIVLCEDVTVSVVVLVRVEVEAVVRVDVLDDPEKATNRLAEISTPAITMAAATTK